MIMEGLVFAPSGRVAKASSALAVDTPLEVRGRLPYVSRGGLKLAHALDVFSLPVGGWNALDLGLPPGASPTVCCNEVSSTYTPWTWATGNCTCGSVRTRGSQ